MSIPGGWELVLILLVVVLLFGAKKLPDAARSLGRSMRIFKSEVKEMHNDDQQQGPQQMAIEQQPVRPQPIQQPQPVQQPYQNPTQNQQ